MTESSTPASLGYRWPAEWEPHAATWVAWPHNRRTWPGKFELVPAQFARMVEAIAEHEAVHILAGADEVMADARSHVGGNPNITLHPIRTNDAWCRDHGPTFLIGLTDRPPALVDWDFNGWGNKYSSFNDDNNVPAHIAAICNRRRFVPGIVLEGGAIDGNGCGAILTTEQCLFHPSRNPGLSRADWEWYLAEYLGGRKILWLTEGRLAGDDTDGHVDQIARFVNPNTIVAAVEEDSSDENHEPLRRNLAQLREMTDQDGRPLNVIPLPLPRPKSFQSQRLPASYVNFYIANGLVLVPGFEDPADQVAVQILAPHFPGRQVLSLPALELVWGLGAFHCLTQQEPVWYDSDDELSERVV